MGKYRGMISKLMRANLELLSQLNEASLSITTLPQAGKTTRLPWGVAEVVQRVT
jgi:hypothetical protein